MSKYTVFQHRRYTSDVLETITGAPGEFIINLSKNDGRGMLTLHDGETPGGIDISPFQVTEDNSHWYSTSSVSIGSNTNLIHNNSDFVIGANNDVDGYYVIVTGQNNIANGHMSTILSGSNTETRGMYTMAIGNSAKAKFDGSIVFADSTDVVAESDDYDQMVIQHKLWLLGNVYADKLIYGTITQANNSTYLHNQPYTFYLDYNNFFNTPTIPLAQQKYNETNTTGAPKTTINIGVPYQQNSTLIYINRMFLHPSMYTENYNSGTITLAAKGSPGINYDLYPASSLCTVVYTPQS